MRCRKPKLYQNFTTLGDIGTLKPLGGLKSLTTTKVIILNVPSEIDLLLLATNLCYQSKLIMDGNSYRTVNLTANECTYQAIKIHRILDDYKNRYITNDEFKQIQKDFKLNSLYH